MRILTGIGGRVLANACGPCIGQWKRHDVQKGDKNSIITSFNRNFAGRNDANPDTHAFVASPEIVTAFALAGTLEFNPMTDTLRTGSGEEVMLEPPMGSELPPLGFAQGESGFVPPSENGRKVDVRIDPASERLQKLAPFEPWNGKDFTGLRVLLKAKGKCTTDHISPAGKWLRFRGHLDNISNNMFSGAVNAFTGEAGKGKNVLTGQTSEFHSIAREYKRTGTGWVVIGDENYGEGSSREHAAMEPRWLGGVAIIVKSFARIHETNLKKQGILPLTFADPADYDRVREDDQVALTGLRDLAPGRPVRMVLTHADGTSDVVMLNHSYNDNQIQWFRAGSALNLIAAGLRKKKSVTKARVGAKVKKGTKTRASRKKVRPLKKNARPAQARRKPKLRARKRK
jgi:aconitate hydratase